MTNFDNDLSGVLFRNDKQNSRQPDYRGSATISGVEYWISAARNPGSKFMSLAFQEKEEKLSTTSGASVDEDIPF